MASVLCTEILQVVESQIFQIFICG